MDNIRKKTISGISWSFTSKFGRQFILIIINIILARILSPKEFGLIAMISPIIGFANLFAELGLSAALVQQSDIKQDQLSSVFWFNFSAGVFLCILFILVAPLIAKFYNEPILIPMTMILSSNFLLSSFNIVQNTLLTKDLNFRLLSIIEISAVGISGIIAVVMAVSGYGVWSLVAQSIILSFITAVLLWKMHRWRPNFTFKWKTIRSLLGFSSSLLGTKVLNYWVRNIDYILIGRFIGTRPLGIYNRA
jgi:PST family polysaccharide transporter